MVGCGRRPVQGGLLELAGETKEGRFVTPSTYCMHADRQATFALVEWHGHCRQTSRVHWGGECGIGNPARSQSSESHARVQVPDVRRKPSGDRGQQNGRLAEHRVQRSCGVLDSAPPCQPGIADSVTLPEFNEVPGELLETRWVRAGTEQLGEQPYNGGWGRRSRG